MVEPERLSLKTADGTDPARVESGLKRLLEEKLCSQVVSVIDPNNVTHLPLAFDHLRELGVRRWVLCPSYSAHWTDQDCNALEAALGELSDKYADSFGQGEPIRIDAIDSKIYTHVRSGISELSLCSMGLREFAVAPSGRVYPCDRMVHEDTDMTFCIGDVDEGIDEAKRNRLVNQTRKVDDECEQCEYVGRCMHWRGCVNSETMGDPGSVSPLVCWFQRCFIKAADRMAERLFSQHNPRFMKTFYRV